MGQSKADPLGYQVFETPLWSSSDFNLLLTLRSFYKAGGTVIRMSGRPDVRLFLTLRSFHQTDLTVNRISG